MAGGDLVPIVLFAVAVGVAIGLGYRVRQLEETAAMLRSACRGKDDTIRALARENAMLKDLVLGELVSPADLWPRHDIITVSPRKSESLH